MKAPSWHQSVLIITQDPEFQAIVKPAFSAESEVLVSPGFAQAIELLTARRFHVLIIDQAAFEDVAKLFEVSQVASQMNHRLTIIGVVGKLQLLEGDFALKCGASLLMSRKEISIDEMIYVIRVMRKRTFRTVFLRDLAHGFVAPVNLYCFLPSSNRYAVLVPAGERLTRERRPRLTEMNISHLYAQGDEHDEILKSLGPDTLTARTARLRERFRRILTQLFDISSDGRIQIGKEMLEQGLSIVSELETLASGFESPIDTIETLPYPRWSAIAQGMNCALYSLLFARACRLEPVSEIAFGALIHNIGLSQIPQSLLAKPEPELTEAERLEYGRHGQAGLALLKRKRVPLAPEVEQILLSHHEHHDGSGFPDHLSLEEIPHAAALVSIAGSYDHFKSLRGGIRAVTAFEAWDRLKQHHSCGSALGRKFHPELLQAIESAIFMR